MIDSYQITHAGRTWHGNVALSEHHLFERDARHWLLLVRDMVAVPITTELAGAIARMIPGPGSLIPDSMMQALRACGLVTGLHMNTPNRPAPIIMDQERARSSRYPVVNLALFLAQKCNMRCIYCYGDAGEYGRQGLMDPDTAMAAVDWLMENSLDAERVTIGFFGGEPLLNFPLLQQVVAYSKVQAADWGKQIEFTLTTNGSRLTDKIIAYLQAEHIIPMISFDGPPDIQDRQRPFRNGRGSHTRVYANVQKLRVAFPQLTARATVYGDGDPFTVRQALDAAGFATCLILPASPVSGYGTVSDQDSAEASARELAMERMLAYQRGEVAALFTAIRNRTIDTTTAPIESPLLAALVTGHKRHYACGVGRAMIAVSATGDIYPCHRFVGQESVRLGHIRDYRAGALTEFHRAVVDRLPVCRHCWARYCCGGGCFHDNQGYTRDPHRPDPLYCRKIKTLCEDLIHGWYQLDDADHAYVRKYIVIDQTASHSRIDFFHQRRGYDSSPVAEHKTEEHQSSKILCKI